MIIVGVNSSHNATACLLKDGYIIACVSEERLNRTKNYWGMPYLAIRECLEIAKLKISDIDYLALNFLDPKVHANFKVFESEDGKFKKTNLLNIKEHLLTKAPKSRYIYDSALTLYYRLLINPKSDRKFKQDIESKIGLPSSKIITLDHHSTHGLSAYYSSPLTKNKPVLIFTLDSSGDGVCATVSKAQGDKIERIATTRAGSSLSDLYMYTTIFLGMKPVEHEYKVMGLAPYSDRKFFQPLLNKIKDLVRVNSNLTFSTKVNSQLFYKLLPKLFAYERFDNIAAAVQTFTEELVCEWVKSAIKQTGTPDIVCAGGTFMNVKVNQKVAELKEVKSLFVMPSASDESTAIGAAYGGYQLQRAHNPQLPPIQSLTHLYLGRDFSDEVIEKILKNKKNKKFIVTKPSNLELTLAKILAKGEIVARFAGRSEWGARSLGNRSILAHPAKLEVIAEINKQIKSRDFWMPFAPSILFEDKDKYFKDKKNASSDYMIITFDSTPEGIDKLKAATHQYDGTLRPQVIQREWNPSYYKLIEEFKKQNGIGGVLNTSFNLHGFPIVYTPEDALFVFENSGLKFLSLGPYLISKRI